MPRQILSVYPDGVGQKAARAVLLLILIGIPSISKAQITQSNLWDPRFFAAEAPPITAIAVGHNGSLYVGGDFDVLGGVRTGAIAKWDGHEWTALGRGVRGGVKDIEVGSGGEIYVAGNLSIVRTGSTTSLARWNGRLWEDAGLHLPTDSLSGLVPLYISKSAAGPVFAGGGSRGCGRSGECSVTAGGLYRWSGIAWSTHFQEDVQVLDLESDEIGTVYSLTRSANGRQQIHVWDDAASSGHELPFPADQLYFVTDMVVNTGGDLLVCGRPVSDAGPDRPFSGVARWDGTKWIPVGTGSSSVTPANLAVANNRSLYLARAESDEAIVLERWTTENDWTVVDSLAQTGVVPSIQILWSGGSLVAAGQFMEPTSGSRNLARWNGEIWSDLVPHGWGANGEVLAFVSGEDGSLYVGGGFSRIGGITAAHVAKWDGDVWTSLGGGTDGEIRALAVGPDGQVYVGGQFEHAGAVQANGIARWDGSEWAPLGSGLTVEPSGGRVIPGHADVLATDEGGGLYVAGWFDRAGNEEAASVARWDGERWSPVDHFPAEASIHSLAVLESDSIFAGAALTNANGEREEGVFFWDGNSLSSVGKTYAPHGLARVWTLAATDGKLYAGGYFTEIDGVPASRLAVWNGVRWQAVNSSGTDAGLSAGVFALASDAEGRLYVGGDFEWATSVSASHVALWDGERWSALAGGISRKVWARVRALEVATDGALMVGGTFTDADVHSSVNIARWTGSVASNELRGDLAETSQLTAHPNPFVQSVNVFFRNERAQEVQLVLYDLLGREVFADDQYLMPGVHRFDIDASDLASGVYVLSAVGPEVRSSITLVHVRE